MAKRIKKIESGSNMDGSNMEGTKPNIKRVRLNSPNAPEYPPRVSLGRKRIDWGKKGNTPTGKGGSGSANAVGNFGAAMEKEDGGDGSFGDGGGTVFTSTNAGIFTPTHGGDGKTQRVKSKKKRSGIERLGVFLTDGSPEKKMKKKATVLKDWVEKQQEEELPKFVEEGEEEEDTSNKIVAEQLDMENKIKMINDEEKNKEDDNRPSTDIASAHITDVQLAKQPQAFGNPQDDELKRGAKKDNSRREGEKDLELSEIEIEDILKYMGIAKFVKKEEPLIDLKKSNDSTLIAQQLMQR